MQQMNEFNLDFSYISISNLSKRYEQASQSVEVLSDLSLQFAKGDFAAIMGPSGSGKTTLLNIIGGLDRPTSGSVTIDSARIDQMPENKLCGWRALNVGFVFQQYYLIPTLSAERNVELPLLLRSMNGSERMKRVRNALELVGLTGQRHNLPKQLSGGQQQRVSLARALVSDAKILICDEPTGNLDRATADEILSILKILNSEWGKTVLMVTHDPKAAQFANSIFELDKGILKEQRLTSKCAI